MRGDRKTRAALGQRLRALRKGAHLSQERLGSRAGLSGKFIGEVERGEKSISYDSMTCVSRALDVSVMELVVDGKTRAPEIDMVVGILVRKPPAMVKRALRMVTALTA